MPPRTLLRPIALLALLALAACHSAAAEPKVLYEKQSAYNTIVVTEDADGLRTLAFERNGVRQSVVKPGDPDRVELPYARAMPVGLALVEEPRRVLIVGLGGGTIPSLLRKHYPRMTIDVVDIDPEVVAVAKRFFGFREDAAMHAYVRDGRQFIEQCREPYDLVFLDAYGSENIPYHLATREFLAAARRAVGPKGAVVGNVFDAAYNRYYDAMVRTYQAVFDELYVLDVPDRGNKILVGLPHAARLEQAELTRRARALSRQKALPFDLGDLVAAGWHRQSFVDPRVRVLLDKDKPAE
jgi:spermidine synthase